MMKAALLLQPLLFATSPILSSFTLNAGSLWPEELVVPILVVTAATVALMGIGTALGGRLEVVSPILSAFWMLFFVHGLLYSWRPISEIMTEGDLQSVTAGQLILVLAWSLLLALFATLVVRLGRRRRLLVVYLAVVGIVTFGIPAATLVSGLVTEKDAAHLQLAGPIGAGKVRDTPSIYYIILDSYASAGVLRDSYNADNGWFLAELRRRGFLVEESRANYTVTNLSLSSSLNMSYLDELTATQGRSSDDLRPAKDLVRNSAVVSYLKSRGYKYVALSSGYLEQELSNADVYMSAPWSLSAFQLLLVNRTPLAILTPFLYDSHRHRVNFVLDHLPDPASYEQPAFVFAHVLAPHPPYVFEESGSAAGIKGLISFGNLLDREDDISGYGEETAFISHRVLDTVDRILAKSREPPIIVLQSDHGSSPQWTQGAVTETDISNRIQILNAYYLPGEPSPEVYDGITPVNTFRVILNHYFGANLSLLPDRSYLASEIHPYDFTEVENPPELRD